MKKRKKKKLKLRKQVYYVFILIILLAIGIPYGISRYNEYKYQQTNEYKLLQKGYTLEEVKLMQSRLSENNLNIFLATEKNEYVISLLNQKYFLEKNLFSYIEYIEEEEDYSDSMSDVVALVNTHATHKWYQYDLDSDLNKKEKVIVNKFFKLPEDYTPDNLENISLKYSYGSLGSNKLTKEAYEHFLELWNAAHQEGYYLMVTSSYRDYQSQKEIYDYRKSTQGERKADETAARPGHSEHQTGLVVDMTSTTEPYVEEFTNSQAYQWLKANAHKYGYIERYQEGKTYITGYSPESWHWRYVGVETATKLYEEQITYDEYYAYYIEK